LDFWHLPETPEKRMGSCFYAGKLKGIHGAVPENIPKGSIEILRSDKMTTEEVRELFWRTEVFYCYEDTALAIEAILCGCPTIFVRNKYFAGPPLAANETGKFGWSMSDEEGGLEQATATIGEFSEHINSYMHSIPSKIAILGASWRAQAQERPYAGTIKLPFEPRIMLFDQPLPPAFALGGIDEFHTGAKALDSVPTLVRLSRILIVDTLKTQGFKGTARRVIAGLKNHGVSGFLRILSGRPPKREE
jgi:hypothetical protein